MNDPIQRILIRFPNWVGDVVMAEPVIRILKSNIRRLVADRGCQLPHSAKTFIVAGDQSVDARMPHQNFGGVPAHRDDDARIRVIAFEDTDDRRAFIGY